MKKALFFVLMILVAATAFAQFRDSTWGDDKEMVIVQEGPPLVRSDVEHRDYLAYSDESLGMARTILFEFFRDDGVRKLYRAAYLFAIDSYSSATWARKYETVKNALIGIYGSGESADEWVSAEQRNFWGDDPCTALSLEMVVLGHRWITDDTAIVLKGQNSNYEFSLVLLYSSLEFRDAGEAASAQDRGGF